jgi:ribosomal protein S11
MRKLLMFLMIASINYSFAQWVQVNNGMGNLSVNALAYSGNDIFAGSGYPTGPNGVYKSTDNGTSWIQTSLNNREVTSFAVNGNNIFAGTSGQGVYLSTDNGTTWTQTSFPLIQLGPLATNGNYIFAGNNQSTNPQGVYLSTNNGTNWIQTSLNNRCVWSLAVNGNYVFAGTAYPANGVYKSTDNGTTWTQTSLNNRYVWSLAVNGNNIFAGTNSTGGVYKSTDNGTSWSPTATFQDANSLVVSGNNVFTGTQSDGVFISTNNGTSWTQRNEGLPANIIMRSLCILNNYIFAGTFNLSVYRRPLGELTGIQPISNEVPNQFSLSQNYPNPFNPKTIIRFAISSNVKSQTSNVKLILFDVLGREVATLVNEELKPGTYEVDWDGTNFPSGVYYYKLVVNTPHPDKSGHPSQEGIYTETKKMVLLR